MDDGVLAGNDRRGKHQVVFGSASDGERALSFEWDVVPTHAFATECQDNAVVGAVQAADGNDVSYGELGGFHACSVFLQAVLGAIVPDNPAGLGCVFQGSVGTGDDSVFRGEHDIVFRTASEGETCFPKGTDIDFRGTFVSVEDGEYQEGIGVLRRRIRGGRGLCVAGFHSVFLNRLCFRTEMMVHGALEP